MHALLLENEQAITGMTPGQIQKQLDAILDAMIAAVKRSLITEGYLPGPIHLHRKGPLLFQRAQKMAHIPEWHVVGLDKVIKAMTGRDMPCQYKETSRGGLARCC